MGIVFFRPTVGNNWTTDANWSSGAKPTSMDVARFDSESGDVVLDAPNCECLSVDFTGYKGTVTRLGVGAIVIGKPQRSDVVLSDEMNPTAGLVCTWESPADDMTITSNGNAILGGTLAGTGRLSVVDSLTVASLLTITRGTFGTNGKSVTIGRLTCNSTEDRKLILRDSTIVVTSQNSRTWDCGRIGFVDSVGLTVECGTSVIFLANTSSTLKRFNGGGNKWHIVRCLRGGTGAFEFRGNNTFHAIQATGPDAPITLRFYGGNTQSFTGDNPLPSGVPGNLVTIESDATEAATHTLHKDSGIVTCDYLHLRNSAATGGAQWYAGSHSIDGGGNSGWIFADPPA